MCYMSALYTDVIRVDNLHMLYEHPFYSFVIVFALCTNGTDKIPVMALCKCKKEVRLMCFSWC